MRIPTLALVATVLGATVAHAEDVHLKGTGSAGGQTVTGEIKKGKIGHKYALTLTGTGGMFCSGVLPDGVEFEGALTININCTDGNNGTAALLHNKDGSGITTTFNSGSVAGSLVLKGNMTQAASSGGLPSFNASCPMGIEVHVDEGGPVYINGDEAKLEKFNDNYYEAKVGSTAISLSRESGSAFDVSYTAAGGANGICKVQ